MYSRPSRFAPLDRYIAWRSRFVAFVSFFQNGLSRYIGIFRCSNATCLAPAPVTRSTNSLGASQSSGI